MTCRIIIGDCVERMRELPDNGVDSVVCDPPYHLTSIVKRFGSENAAPCKVGKTGAYARASKGFMGQTWDGGDVAFRPETWAEVLRVLKPGGHLVAFSGTRTYHRMAVAIEDAGFEVRDMVSWIYGSGFPKSHDISKAIDKAAGAEREVVGKFASFRPNKHADTKYNGNLHTSGDITAPATDASRQWQGYGTALKPALEPCCLARKPLSEKSVAANCLRWGTGALNIDATRIPTNGEKISPRGSMDAQTDIHEGWARPWMADKGKSDARLAAAIDRAETLGKWPSNLCHDGSDEVLAGFPIVTSGQPAGIKAGGSKNVYGEFAGGIPVTGFGDSGSAARFFYTAKSSSSERGEGNIHPTVKPVALMRWLVRLVTPKGGTVLDPFMGSGSTLIAADAEQFNAIGIELSPEYAAIAERRIRDAAGLFAQVEAA